MERDRESSLAEGLNRFRFAQQTGAGGYQYLTAAVRIHGVGDEAVDWRRGPAIEPVRQHGIDDRALENSMQRTGVVDRIGMRWTLRSGAFLRRTRSRRSSRHSTRRSRRGTASGPHGGPHRRIGDVVE